MAAPQFQPNFSGKPASSDQMFQQLQTAQAAQQENSLAQQRALQERLKGLQQKDIPVDLSPLAALTDQWTGSNTAQSYRPAETVREREQKMMNVQAQMRNASSLEHKANLANLKDQMGFALGKEDREFKKKQLQADQRHKAAMRGIAAARLTQETGKPMAPKDTLQARTALIKSKQAVSMEGIIQLNSALNAYEEGLKAHGIRALGKESTKLRSLYSDVVKAVKKAEDLGALQAADMELVRKIIPEGGGIEAAMSSYLTGGEQGIHEAIGVYRKSSGETFDNHRATLQQMFSGPQLEKAVAGQLGEYDKQWGLVTQGGKSTLSSNIKPQEKTLPSAADPASRVEFLEAIQDPNVDVRTRQRVIDHFGFTAEELGE